MIEKCDWVVLAAEWVRFENQLATGQCRWPLHAPVPHGWFRPTAPAPALHGCPALRSVALGVYTSHTTLNLNYYDLRRSHGNNKNISHTTNMKITLRFLPLQAYVFSISL